MNFPIGRLGYKLNNKLNKMKNSFYNYKKDLI